jgi:hypothetical protein
MLGRMQDEYRLVMSVLSHAAHLAALGGDHVFF